MSTGGAWVGSWTLSVTNGKSAHHSERESTTSKNEAEGRGAGAQRESNNGRRVRRSDRLTVNKLVVPEGHGPRHLLGTGQEHEKATSTLALVSTDPAR